jgi:hypothetical protein
MRRKKISGSGPADYIIPIAVVIGGIYLINKVTGIFSEGSASNPSNVPGMANLSAQGKINTTAQNNINSFMDTNPTYTAGQSWSTGYLYNQDNTNTTLDPADAQALWDTIQANWSIWPWNCNNFLPVLQAFQAACQNQTDISYVATLVPGAVDLLVYLQDHYGVACSSGDGAANPANTWAFIQWANSLPVWS